MKGGVRLLRTPAPGGNLEPPIPSPGAVGSQVKPGYPSQINSPSLNFVSIGSGCFSNRNSKYFLCWVLSRAQGKGLPCPSAHWFFTSHHWVGLHSSRGCFLLGKENSGHLLPREQEDIDDLFRSLSEVIMYLDSLKMCIFFLQQTRTASLVPAWQINMYLHTLLRWGLLSHKTGITLLRRCFMENCVCTSVWKIHGRLDGPQQPWPWLQL